MSNLSTRGSRGLLIRTNDTGRLQTALEVDASYDDTLFNLFNVRNVGNVGIGINEPTARLHVRDSSVLFDALNDVPNVSSTPRCRELAGG